MTQHVEPQDERGALPPKSVAWSLSQAAPSHPVAPGIAWTRDHDVTV